MASYKGKQTVNTFSKGMIMDLDKSLQDPNSYRYAENFRLVTKTTGTTGILENVEGNTQYIDLSDVKGTILHTNTIRNYLIIFSLNGTLSNIYVYDISIKDSSVVLKWEETTEILNFNENYPIFSTTTYENDKIIKIYWVDGLNPIRLLNIAISQTELDTYTIEKFDYLPNLDTVQPEIVTVTSGKLKSGKIQYCYQLFNTNGAETTISPLSNVVDLTTSSYGITNSKGFIGSDINVDSYKGVTIKVPSNTNLHKYDNVRIISIFYNSISQLPIVNIVAEEPVNGTGDFVFTDYGTSTIGELTLEELVEKGSALLKPKHIQSKNNRLFIANVLEDTWDPDLSDYDTRAYSFSKTGSSYLKDTTLGDITDLNISNLDNYNIPSNHDCINPTNTIEYSITNVVPTYRYNKNLSQLGASGKNIEIYLYTISDNIIGTSSSSKNVGVYVNYANSTYKLYEDRLSYQRDETYRFGIVFKNIKCQNSPVYWICDYRMPDIYESPLTTVQYDANNNPIVYINKLAVGIKVKNCSILYSKGITGFEIVRVKRSTNDKSIIAQGVLSQSVKNLSPLEKDITDSYCSNYIPFQSSFSDSSIYELLSPESSYFDDVANQDVQYIEKLTAFRTHVYAMCNDSDDSRKSTDNAVQMNPSDINDDDKYFGRSFVMLPGTQYSNTAERGIYGKALINSTNIKLVKADSGGTYSLSSQPSYVLSNGYKYRPHVSPAVETPTKTIQGIAGRRLLFTLKTSESNYKNGNFSTVMNSGDYPFCYYLANLRKSNVGQYGGNTYESRTNNNYISTGTSSKIDEFSTTVEVAVTDGDIYLGIHEYLHTMTREDSADWYCCNIFLLFPVESSINLKYTQGERLTAQPSLAKAVNFMFLKEDPGVYGNGMIEFNQDTNYYIYNTAYSRQPDAVTFFAKRLYTNTNKNYDCRVYYSDYKYNGETVDSWTSIKLLNYKDVDSRYGSINRLDVTNNTLFFWQDKAFGFLSVNEREVTQSTTGTSLILGTGGVLDRYDYYSTVNGLVDSESETSSDNIIYWFDRLNNEFCVYSRDTGVNKFSKTAHIQSYLNNFDNIITPIIGFDNKYNEINFSIKGTLSGINNNKTLIFSELINNFISLYTFIPDHYVESQYGLFTIKDKKLWKQNNGNKGDFYGTISDSTLKLIVNDEYLVTKVFDNISYFNTSVDNNTNMYKDSNSNKLINTFYKIRCYNDYQNTDYTNLVYGNNIQRREREFTIQIPRNVVSVVNTNNPDIFNPDNLDTTMKFQSRLLDKYMIIDLAYNNEDNLSFSLSHLITNYRVSSR